MAPKQICQVHMISCRTERNRVAGPWTVVMAFVTVDLVVTDTLNRFFFVRGESGSDEDMTKGYIYIYDVRIYIRLA